MVASVEDEIFLKEKIRISNKKESKKKEETHSPEHQSLTSLPFPPSQNI